MKPHIALGRHGEQVASEYLKPLGYRILDRNVRVPLGELDIVATDPDGILVIVEVKSLVRSPFIRPEDNLTRSKFLKLSRSSQYYANANQSLFSPRLGYRIDLIAVTFDSLDNQLSDICIGKNNFAISHYKNISA